MGSVFLRNDIGIPSESFFAKMERFFIKLASAKLQHEKADSKFFANLWRFEMLKPAHTSSVYGEKFIFLCRRSVQIGRFRASIVNFALRSFLRQMTF